jgi:hypothetical protein
MDMSNFVWMACDWHIRLSFYYPFTFLLIWIGICFVPPSSKLTGMHLYQGLAHGAKGHVIHGASRHWEWVTDLAWCERKVKEHQNTTFPSWLDALPLHKVSKNVQGHRNRISELRVIVVLAMNNQWLDAVTRRVRSVPASPVNIPMRANKQLRVDASTRAWPNTPIPLFQAWKCWRRVTRYYGESDQCWLNVSSRWKTSLQPLCLGPDTG